MATQGRTYSRTGVRPVFIFASGARFRPKSAANIKYGNKVDRQHVPGAGSIGPVALATGDAKPDWAMDCTKEDFNALIAKMGAGYIRQSFTIIVTGKEAGLADYEDTIEGAMLGDDHDVAVPNMVGIGGLCTKVKPNGVDPFGDEDVEL